MKTSKTMLDKESAILFTNLTRNAEIIDKPKEKVNIEINKNKEVKEKK